MLHERVQHFMNVGLYEESFFYFDGRSCSVVNPFLLRVDVHLHLHNGIYQ